VGLGRLHYGGMLPWGVVGGWVREW
jgi:hypothetical protein